QVFDTEAKRRDAMQLQLAEILTRIDSTPEVQSTDQKLEAVKVKLENLRKSQSRLTNETHQLSKQLAEFSTQSENEIILGTEIQELARKLLQKEAEHRLATRAHQRLVEQMLPET